MAITGLAKRSRGWLTASFMAGATLVNTTASSYADVRAPAPLTQTNDLPLPRLQAANDNGVCIADITPQNIQKLTGFTDMEALQQASALIRQMNDRNGTPIAVLAILEASDRIGISFELMIAKAIVESRLGVFDKPIGVNGSARGVFQFMPATWLSVFHDFGDRYENGKYTDLAKEISINSKGIPSVADKTKEAEILALRSDPRVASFLKAVYLKEVETPQLRSLLKRDPEAVDYYMLHLLGLPRMTLFMTRMAVVPSGKATIRFAREARFNRGVFYNSKGHARSYKQVYDHLGALMQNYIDLVRDTAAEAEKSGECIDALTFGQTPPPPAPVPPPIPTPRPPQDEIDKLLGKPIANDNKTGNKNTVVVDVPLQNIPVPTPAPRGPAL
ncbi:MAG: hypothetical protein KJ667_08975 [Alphaproteobacteria bacterium]|nr:hypothetical protein [Alphaproteobacteria bacterium]